MVDQLTSGTLESVGIGSPPLRLNLLGDGLDQVAVGGAHADPKREVSPVV